MYIAKKSRLGETDLNAKGYSAKEERRVLDALGRGLGKEFPNPERVGCPGTDILKRVAAQETPLSEAEKWLDHLGSCSPCYAEFKRFQEAHESSRRRILLATAAGIILAVAFLGWALVHKRNEDLIAQSAVLDLRDRSPARGTEPNSTEPPLEISRRVSHLKIYLPVGSSDGTYEIRILGSGERVLFVAEGAPKVQQGTMSVTVDTNLSGMSPGLYILTVQKRDSRSTSYPLNVK